MCAPQGFYQDFVFCWTLTQKSDDISRGCHISSGIMLLTTVLSYSGSISQPVKHVYRCFQHISSSTIWNKTVFSKNKSIVYPSRTVKAASPTEQKKKCPENKSTQQLAVLPVGGKSHKSARQRGAMQTVMRTPDDSCHIHVQSKWINSGWTWRVYTEITPHHLSFSQVLKCLPNVAWVSVTVRQWDLCSASVNWWNNNKASSLNS